MANQEHLDILKQEVKMWNQWRKEHADIQPDLSGADLEYANLSRANLSGTNLSRTLLIETYFNHATLTDCIIYGIAAWNVYLEGAIQKNLIITEENEGAITVDNLKVAQFIYLMLDNKEIRNVNLT